MLSRLRSGRDGSRASPGAYLGTVRLRRHSVAQGVERPEGVVAARHPVAPALLLRRGAEPQDGSGEPPRPIDRGGPASIGNGIRRARGRTVVPAPVQKSLPGVVEEKAERPSFQIAPGERAQRWPSRPAVSRARNASSLTGGASVRARNRTSSDDVEESATSWSSSHSLRPRGSCARPAARSDIPVATSSQT